MTPAPAWFIGALLALNLLASLAFIAWRNWPWALIYLGAAMIQTGSLWALDEQGRQQYEQARQAKEPVGGGPGDGQDHSTQGADQPGRAGGAEAGRGEGALRPDSVRGGPEGGADAGVQGPDQSAQKAAPGTHL